MEKMMMRVLCCVLYMVAIVGYDAQESGYGLIRLLTGIEVGQALGLMMIFMGTVLCIVVGVCRGVSSRS